MWDCSRSLSGSAKALLDESNPLLQPILEKISILSPLSFESEAQILITGGIPEDLIQSTKAELRAWIGANYLPTEFESMWIQTIRVNQSLMYVSIWSAEMPLQKGASILQS